MAVTVMSGSDPRGGRALARTILDAAAPVDSAARRAISEALARKSIDPVLHAAALWLAFSEGADPRLSRSHARGWILGVHELIDSGHLEAAAYALPRLTAAFPDRPYLENMAFLIRQLPPVVGNGRASFSDDRDSDVQIVAMPGAESVVIDFCGANHGPGISINMLDRWLAQLNSHVVYLRDRKKIGYVDGITSLGPDMKTTLEGLNKVLSDLGAGRVVCLGNSAGASGALRYASALGADRVLALSPITGGPEYAKQIGEHLPPDAVIPWDDLAPLYREDTGVRVRIMYGEKNAGDRQQSMRMAGLPGITVEALADWESHHLVGGLIRAGRLGEVLIWLVSEGDGVERKSL